MARGGYRKPSNPAPVSNPGSGRRTDGGPTQAARYMAGGQYGEGRALMEAQQGAPMAAAPQPRVSGAPAAAAVKNLPPITPLTAPSERPNEPLTAGMPFGAGPGPEVLGTQQPAQSLSQTISKMLPFDTGGELSDLYEYLVSRGM